jgi:nuclear pore complex protein Nup188
VYHASPEILKQHDLVTMDTGSQYSCTYLAWTYVVSRLSAKATEAPEISESFKPFFDCISPPLNRESPPPDGENMLGFRCGIV